MTLKFVVHGAQCSYGVLIFVLSVFLWNFDMVWDFCRYAYSEETGDEFDEEAISLTGSGVKVAGDLATILERKERKVVTAPDHHVFGIGEDVEEDKRE